jgi:hypothetical protein
MKNLKKSWKLIAIFVFGAIAVIFYVGRSRAFAQGSTSQPNPTVTIDAHSVPTSAEEYNRLKFTVLGKFPATVGITPYDGAGNPLVSLPTTITVPPGETKDYSFFNSGSVTTSTVPGFGTVVNPAETRFEITLTTTSLDSPMVVFVDNYTMNQSGDFDTRHNFAATLTWDIPGSEHGPRWVTHGWAVNSLKTFHGG